jgi:hypothetical protein
MFHVFRRKINKVPKMLKKELSKQQILNVTVKVLTLLVLVIQMKAMQLV